MHKIYIVSVKLAIMRTFMQKIKSLVIIIQKGAFNYIIYLLLRGEGESIKWECMQKGGKGVIFMQTFTYNFF